MEMVVAAGWRNMVRDDDDDLIWLPRAGCGCPSLVLSAVSVSPSVCVVSPCLCVPHAGASESVGSLILL